MGSFPALKIDGVSKTFSGTKALNRVSLEMQPGEIRGLVGHNGSGKSTLIKILSGFHAPDGDGGQVAVNGQPVPLPIPPGGSRQLGFGFVYQDLGLVPQIEIVRHLVVTELGWRPRRVLRWRSEITKARALLGRYGIHVDPRLPVAAISSVDRARVAIARAAAEIGQFSGVNGFRGVLFLDEPTAFLPAHEIEQLFALMREMAREGTAIMFVSHKLEEVLGICDQVTVLRDGTVVVSEPSSSLDRQQLVELIVGHPVVQEMGSRGVGKRSAGARVRGLTTRTLRGVDFDVEGGEILGLTGLLGSGFKEVVHALFGALPNALGRLEIHDESVDLADLTPNRAVALQIGLLPGDRLGTGLVGALPVAENLAIVEPARYRKYGLLSRREMRRRGADAAMRSRVRPPDPSLLVLSLSGGNQQKVLFAKWVEEVPRLLLLDEPTQGVDVGAREEIFRLLRDTAAEGAAVVCASDDHEQLADICDRVLVFTAGRISRELVGNDVTKERISRASLGAGEV